MYGVLERQFSKYFEKSQKANGVTGELLLQWLERRLDNVVYRLSFAESRKQARQFVLHGHFTVNSRPVNIPSFSVKPGDIIKWHPNRAGSDFVKTAVTDLPKREVPSWLNLNTTSLEGEVLSLPAISDIDAKIDTRLIVEYYSK
jgi:small subunit ribosomal protein S4